MTQKVMINLNIKQSFPRGPHKTFASYPNVVGLPNTLSKQKFIEIYVSLSNILLLKNCDSLSEKNPTFKKKIRNKTKANIDDQKTPTEPL